MMPQPCLPLDQAHQHRLLLALARRLDHVVAQVRAIEPDVDHRRVGIREAELREDVVLDLRRRGRGQREHRRLAERAHRFAEAEVRRAEVVTPLRDAVRLVDHEQRDADLRQVIAEPRFAEPLGRDVRDARAILREPRQRRLLVARRQRRVEPQHFDVELGELVVLILHQRDQRRHHERHAIELERGQLVAQRLARTGRHDRERVDAGEHVANRERLAGPELVEVEPAARELEHVRVDRLGIAGQVERIDRIARDRRVVRIDDDRVGRVDAA